MVDQKSTAKGRSGMRAGIRKMNWTANCSNYDARVFSGLRSESRGRSPCPQSDELSGLNFDPSPWDRTLSQTSTPVRVSIVCSKAMEVST